MATSCLSSAWARCSQDSAPSRREGAQGLGQHRLGVVVFGGAAEPFGEAPRRLRRRRRINDAKPVLTEALRTFRRLGAQSWEQRAQAELRACGVAMADVTGEPDALAKLTPQQRQIVRLASEGLTDREIGDRLFLSPRTVSSHLHRSYPKLGVASRHQLRDMIARATMPAPPRDNA